MSSTDAHASPSPLCALVPTYNNPATVRGVVEDIRSRGLDVIVVDDGSDAPGRSACEAIAKGGLADVVHLAENQGKAAACVAGFRRARELGFGRAFQIDADGQHDMAAIEEFVRVSDASPDAMVAAYPIYDSTAPLARRVARKFTAMWVAIEVGGRRKIRDALIGFRVYPVDATLALPRHGSRMQFDPEVAVRLVRRGTPVINLPVHVRYLDASEGGISHFKPLRDNLAYAGMHTRLCIEGCFGLLLSPLRKRTPKGVPE